MVVGIVKSASKEPKAIQCFSQGKTFVDGKRSSILEVGLPFLERVDFFVLDSHLPCFDKRSDQGQREWSMAVYVGGLRGIVRDELHNIVQRTVLGFSSLAQDE